MNNFVSDLGRAIAARFSGTPATHDAGAAANLPAAHRAPGAARPRAATFIEGVAPQPNRVLPAPSKPNAYMASDHTTLAEIVTVFGGLEGKRLRVTSWTGFPEVYTHQQGKINNPFTAGKRRSAAYDFMLEVVTRELGGNRSAAETLLADQGCSRSRGVPTRSLQALLSDVREIQYRDKRAQAASPENVAARTAKTDEFIALAPSDEMTRLVPAGSAAALSDKGMGGAILVTGHTAGGPGLVAVIKPDSEPNCRKAEFVGVLGQALTSAGSMMGFPISERLALSAVQKEGLKAVIGPRGPDDPAHQRANEALDNLDAGNAVRMMPVIGKNFSHPVTALDQAHLSAAARRELLTCGHMGRDVGYAAILSTVTGLDDHACLDGGPGADACFNFENFMLGEDGVLYAIDPTVSDPDSRKDGLTGWGTSSAQMLVRLNGVTVLLQRAADAAARGAEALDAFADTLREDSRKGNGGVLGPIITNLLIDYGKNGFFNTQADLDGLGQEGKRTVILDMLSGLADGLKFVQENTAALVSGYSDLAAHGFQHVLGTDPQTFFSSPAAGFQPALGAALGAAQAFKANQEAAQ